MASVRNEYAVSYETGREFAKAATIYNAHIRFQKFIGANVLFFDALEHSRIVRHYIVQEEKERTFDVRTLYPARIR